MTYNQMLIAYCSEQLAVKSTNGSRVRPYIAIYALLTRPLECLLPIMDETASTKPPPYSTVIKHDHRLRDYPMQDFPIPGASAGPNRSFFAEGGPGYRRRRGATRDRV